MCCGQCYVLSLARHWGLESRAVCCGTLVCACCRELWALGLAMCGEDVRLRKDWGLRSHLRVVLYVARAAREDAGRLRERA